MIVAKRLNKFNFAFLRAVSSEPSTDGFKLSLMFTIPSRCFSKKIHDNFSFPKHHELFTPQNLETEDNYTTDEEDLGILRRYDSKRSMSAQQIMAKDFNQVRQRLDREIQDTYSVDPTSDKAMIEHTQSMISRLKKGRGYQATGEEFKKKRLQSEYLNFGKYQKNYITQDDTYDADDDGREVFHIQKYRDAMKRMNISNSKNEKSKDKNMIKNAASQYSRTKDGSNWLTTFNNMQKALNRDLGKDLEYEDEKFIDKVQRQHNKLDFPNMSPQGKLNVYKDYIGGMNLRDISMKYGIVPERVCAIVWSYEYYFKIVYPRVGESTARFLFEYEKEQNKGIGYWDYGQDLIWMAKHEQGVAAVNFARTALDKYPSKKVKDKVEQALKRTKPRRVIEVPLKHVGKGPGGHLLKEILARGGKMKVKSDKDVRIGIRRANVIRKMGYE